MDPVLAGLLIAFAQQYGVPLLTAGLVTAGRWVVPKLGVRTRTLLAPLVPLLSTAVGTAVGTLVGDPIGTAAVLATAGAGAQHIIAQPARVALDLPQPVGPAPKKTA